MSMRIASLNAVKFRIAVTLTAVGACTAVSADDVTGSDSLLCYAMSAARCELDGTCALKAPWQLNLPDFLKLDLKAKQAVTTEASGQQLATPISSVQRADNGTLVLQGMQGDRAFSWLITEATGEGTLTVSSIAAGLTVFTVCTPIDKL
jgi:hypothetical protein